jgi:hypothetical protein
VGRLDSRAKLHPQSGMKNYRLLSVESNLSMSIIQSTCAGMKNHLLLKRGINI